MLRSGACGVCGRVCMGRRPRPDIVPTPVGMQMGVLGCAGWLGVQGVLYCTLCCTSMCVLGKVHAAVQGVLHAWLALQCCPEQGVYAGSIVHATACCYVSAAVHDSKQHAVGSGGAAGWQGFACMHTATTPLGPGHALTVQQPRCTHTYADVSFPGNWMFVVLL